MVISFLRSLSCDFIRIVCCVCFTLSNQLCLFAVSINALHFIIISFFIIIIIIILFIIILVINYYYFIYYFIIIALHKKWI